MDQNAILRHIELIHQCRECGDCFSNLKIHIDDIHGQNSIKHQCQSCEKTFYDLENLQKHLKNGHEKISKCELCGKVLRSRSRYF